MTFFFSPGQAGKDYSFNRDDDTRADVRQYCEELWRRYQDLNGDRHFLSDARWNFHARTWEMVLACTLLDYGFRLERPPCDGPDIKLVEDGGEVVWVEAVTIGLGSGADHAGRIETYRKGNTALVKLQPEKTVLRYTSALASKNAQLQSFRERGIVDHNDRYVVAINGARLHDYTANDADPTILKAVYPIGDAFVRFTPYSDEDPEVGYHYRDHVEKAKGTKISTTGFTGDTLNGVSAILYSRTTAWNPNPERANYMLVIHNARAENPVQDGFFPFGREARVEGDKLRWYSHGEDRE